MGRSSTAWAATYAGSDDAGPSVSTERPVWNAASAGTAHSATASPATAALASRTRGIVMAVSSVTIAAPVRPSHARLRPAPGQIATGTPCANDTTTPTARNAVPRPESV